MGRVERPMTRSARILLAIAAAMAGVRCVASSLPVTMAPVRAQERETPASSAILAVLDFVDARPDFERSERAIDEFGIGGRSFAFDRFWSFHSEDASLEADPAAVPERRARVTGDGAFSWYPFPNHGWGKPLPARLSTALADYVALHLEQRRAFTTIFRVRDAEMAREVGATLLLTGRIDRFGAQLTERADPFVVRPDDWVEYRLVAGADYAIELVPITGGEPLLSRRCRARDDQGRQMDALEHYRGSQVQPYWQLDAACFPGDAERGHRGGGGGEGARPGSAGGALARPRCDGFILIGTLNRRCPRAGFRRRAACYFGGAPTE
jgi:hypothetical protein